MSNQDKKPEAAPLTVQDVAEHLTKQHPGQQKVILDVLAQVLENQAKYEAVTACQGLTPQQVRELKKELEDRYGK